MNDRRENGDTVSWKAWWELFERRRGRGLPSLQSGIDCGSLPRSLARSLAIFQLGESGGGTIVDQSRRSNLPGTDEDYVKALELFVAEEHRHANMLALAVRLMRGELIRRNWTARLFVFGRRLIGLRLKVLVLLAAEVAGICYYSSIADRLPAGPMQRWLREIVDDERSHLAFHCDFLRCQTGQTWRRRLFVAVWRCVIRAAGIVVLVDHRRTLREMAIDRGVIWRRWMVIADQAERLVTEKVADAEAFGRCSTAEVQQAEPQPDRVRAQIQAGGPGILA